MVLLFIVIIITIIMVFSCRKTENMSLLPRMPDLSSAMDRFWSQCPQTDIHRWSIQDESYYNPSISFFRVEVSKATSVIVLSFAILPTKRLLILQDHNDLLDRSWDRVRFVTY